MALKFDNTEIAFKSKTSHDLKSAKLLFNMVSSNSMVKLGRWFTNVAFSIHLPIKGIIKKTIFGIQIKVTIQPVQNLAGGYIDQTITDDRIKQQYLTSFFSANDFIAKFCP